MTLALEDQQRSNPAFPHFDSQVSVAPGFVQDSGNGGILPHANDRPSLQHQQSFHPQQRQSFHPQQSVGQSARSPSHLSPRLPRNNSDRHHRADASIAFPSGANDHHETWSPQAPEQPSRNVNHFSLSNVLTEQPWYFVGGRTQAVERVANKPLGFFVVRPSSKPGCWALTVQEGTSALNGDVVSVLIAYEYGLYTLGQEDGAMQFSSIVDMIRFFVSNPYGERESSRPPAQACLATCHSSPGAVPPRAVPCAAVPAAADLTARAHVEIAMPRWAARLPPHPSLPPTHHTRAHRRRRHPPPTTATSHVQTQIQPRHCT